VGPLWLPALQVLRLLDGLLRLLLLLILTLRMLLLLVVLSLLLLLVLVLVLPCCMVALGLRTPRRPQGFSVEGTHPAPSPPLQILLPPLVHPSAAPCHCCGAQWGHRPRDSSEALQRKRQRRCEASWGPSCTSAVAGSEPGAVTLQSHAHACNWGAALGSGRKRTHVKSRRELGSAIPGSTQYNRGPLVALTTTALAMSTYFTHCRDVCPW